jgi:hypothetical protein
MESTISVPIPTSQFLSLAAFLKAEGDVRDPVDVIVFAIEYFLENAGWKDEDLLVRSESLGYQWKEVFLPSGTRIRVPYKGKYFYAEVEKDQVIYEGESISPSALANQVTGASRNAWKTLWISRPGEKDWTLADDLRRDSAKADEALKNLMQGSPKQQET